MAKHILLPIFLILIATFAVATTTTFATQSNNFITSKCRTTSYPTTCVQSLSYFANRIQQSPRQLAQTALTVSLSRARYAKTFVAQLSHTPGLKPREVGVIKDCREEISDTVDRLGKAIHEFQMAVRTRSGDFLWHMSNVQTWASAALTDENTCVDGFDGKDSKWKTKSAIKDQFVGVMECTSNALALVNDFANKYSP